MKTVKRMTGLLLTIMLLICMSTAYADVKKQFPSKVGDSVLASLLKASKAECFYQIQPRSSDVSFSIDSIAGTAAGKFLHFKGGVALQPEADNNDQVVFVIKSNSVSTSNIAIDKVVSSKSYLDVERYPEILFVSSDFSWLSETKGLLKGKLTLHGVTQAVAFKVELSGVTKSKVGNSDTILVKIVTSISRSKFGMKLMKKAVGDTVKLSMTIRAIKQKSISKSQLAAISSYSGVR
ncbi:MAG: YceI family protein [Pseudomonadota bacterium]|nr:YceI family protein [Pseudomonadota bacterium]